MVLKFIALCFIRLKEILYDNKLYHVWTQSFTDEDVIKLRAKCMAFINNNIRWLQLSQIEETSTSIHMILTKLSSTLRKKLSRDPDISSDSEESSMMFDRSFSSEEFSSEFSPMTRKKTKHFKPELFNDFNNKEKFSIRRSRKLLRAYLYLRKSSTNTILFCDQNTIFEASADCVFGYTYYRS